MYPCILVGVQGAGLQWSIFLRSNSGLLELAHENWNFLFSKMHKGFHGLRVAQLKAKNTKIDWDFIAKVCNHGNPLNETDRQDV